jgi:hypothetical protein
VTLETVVVAHLDGASPEQIVEQYPSVDLASVYGVLTYYLSHCDEVHHNLEEQDEAHRLIKRANEEQFLGNKSRERLLARRRDGDGAK